MVGTRPESLPLAETKSRANASHENRVLDIRLSAPELLKKGYSWTCIQTEVRYSSATEQYRDAK